MSTKKPVHAPKDNLGFIREKKSHDGDCYSHKELPGNSVEREGYDSSLTVPPGKVVFESFGGNRPVNVKRK
ncbi:TPA: hypothetical protein ACSW2J_004297 [Escherichia coli]|uniref:hypothetical protein n=2 Tax=Enterobacteriaceae TaxID=543 RepID=UPI001009F7E4|nr:hypothetical protein [Escherichia coli]EEZ6899904.1 hypothetical protein [Escherichia coli]EFB1173152.1 hypothetical protein [Escherichia coli]EFB3374576.1 hypothetical protein [Escherichia coli]EFB7168799.1 hypothetical protein [Escherichia coli]EFC5308843.1 hypothetical protein [Escherichia coli]